MLHSTKQVTTEIYQHVFTTDYDRLSEGLDRVCLDAGAAHLLHDDSDTVKSKAPRRAKKAV
jgi:hypothetical protein